MSYNVKIIRRLARNSKWQMFYRRIKDSNGFSLFNNATDLSDVQSLFLQWLEIYYNLYQDVAMKRRFIDEEVINDDIRTDAYLLIRDEVIAQEMDISSNDKKKKQKVPTGHSVIFRKG